MLEYSGRTKELSGGDPATTNNRMELTAAVRALEALKKPCEVELLTDSTYLRDGITKWLGGWKARGWITALKAPVKNEDLWRQLDAAATGHSVHWKWLRGHAGHPFNERCDELAAAEITKIRERFSPAQLDEQLAVFLSSRAPVAHPTLLDL